VPGVACYIHSFFSSALSYSSESFSKPERHDDLTAHQTSSRPFERKVGDFQMSVHIYFPNGVHSYPVTVESNFENVLPFSITFT
jgi:hypothetical protein